MTTPNNTKQRQTWGSNLGIILAVAGSAVGLGNFLRFPVQAASNGGGAFMIPYFVSLLLVGIPLMWIEWTIGRYGGGFGHGSAPGVFHSLWRKNRFIKYFGVIGIFGPLVIAIYYLYIESWLLGYTVLSLSSGYKEAVAAGQMESFLSGYQGIEHNKWFSGIGTAYIFFLITFCVNFSVVLFGIRSGIEKVCKKALPLLLIMGIFLVIRIFTLDAPNDNQTVSNALGFMWNPNFSELKNAKVWLAAAGQIFFTLSVGIGVIVTYASYLKKNDDVALSGLSAVSTNEFTEVILGGSIIIPAAFIFFGPTEIISIAKSGAFNLGFVTMPTIFGHIQFGAIFAFVWFFLLFVAGVTSSISLLQPAIAFLEDEFNISRKKAVILISIFCFLVCHAAVFLLEKGVVNELDFWGGTFALVVFATIEVILFAWIFGMDKAWDEMHQGAQMRIPRVYHFIIKYITPSFLLIILGTWFYQDGIPTILMKNISPENKPFVLGTRVMLFGMFTTLAFMVRHAWRKRYRPKKKKEES